jgi:tetratricopeptide (TPR) repeat protein/Tfp pilus assembly protein PilF
MVRAKMPEIRSEGGEHQAPRTTTEAIDGALPKRVIASLTPATTPPSAELERVFDDDGLIDVGRTEALEAELVRAERWSELFELYALAAQRAPDAELGRRMMLSAGLLALEKLGDPRAAEPFLRRILASDPDNLDAIDALRALALHTGRFTEAADFLDRAIAVSADEEKPELLVELAELAFEKLHQVERAIAALHYAFEVDPSRVQILALARRIFVAEERWIDAKNVLDDEARAVLGDGDVPAAALTAPKSDAERASYARAIAEAYRQLGIALLSSASRHDVAEACLERARGLGDNEALSKLDELAHLRKDWEVAAKALRDEALDARDKRKAAQLYLRASELYHAYGKDPIRSEEYLDRCLLLCPGFPPALGFIEAIHLEQGRRDDLVRRLNAMAAAVKDPAVKVEILLHVARLLELDGEGGKAELPQIVAAYRRALTIEPGHRLAVEHVTELLAAQGQHGDRAQILEGQLAATTDEHVKAENHLELGRIYAEMLGDSGRARAHFEAVLALEPGHFEAASALRALYKDAREQALLLSVLKVLVEHSPDLFSRLEMLYEMAKVAADVSREEEFLVQRRIFELDPNAKEARTKLVELAGQLHRYEALADAYFGAAQRRPPTEAFELYLEAARIYDTRLPRPTEAIQAYKRALALRPDAAEVHDALERLLRQQDDPAALVEVLKSQLARATDEEQIPVLLAKIGGVYARELGDLDQAIAMFEKVLELQPKNAAALVALDDLFRRKEDFGSQVSILVRREALAESPADRAELEVRRARVLAERLERREDAADLYLDVLASFPDNGDVIHALSELLARGVSVDRIARALEPVFGQRAEFSRQLDMLKVLTEREPDAKIRKDYARKGRDVAEQRLGNPETAFELAGATLTADPTSEEARATLLRLAEKTANAKAAADVFERILVREDLPAPTLSLLASSLGELAETGLSDTARAIAHYQRALAADGGNAMAIAALERLLGAEERWAELAAVLVERSARSTDRAAKVNLGLSLASLRAERLGDLDGAIEAYREVLAVEPSESTALARLADALEKKERWRELVLALDRLGDASRDPDVKSAIDAKVGDTLRLHLRDTKGALERYQRAIERRADNPTAVRGLEALLDDKELRGRAGALLEPFYEASQRNDELVLALESQLSSTMDAERRRALYLRIASVEARELALPDSAFDTLSRAFRESLVGATERPLLNASAIAAHRAKDLVQLYEDALVGRSFDVDLLRELARLYDGAAADPGAARKAWERVLEKSSNDAEALEALERLHAAGDNPSALAEVLLVRAEAASGADRVGYLRRAAAIYEEAAEDLDRAILAVERAAQELPSDRGTWQELQRLYGLARRTGKMRDALEAEARLVEEPLQRANLLVRLAETSIHLELLEDAVAAYEAALAAVPAHDAARTGLEALMKTPVGPKAALALEPVYRAAGDWSRLVEAYELLARASQESAERVARLVAIRSIYEERLGRVDRAFSAAARAFREAPGNEELLASLERLGRLSGQVEELLALLEDHAESLPFISPERHETRVRIAKFTESLLHDRAQAIDAWKKVLEERPNSLVALQALEKLYARAGEARELVEVLRQMAGLVEDGAERTAMLRRAAQILEQKLGDRAQAARLYERVLNLVPGDLDALRRLDSIYTETKQWEELSQVLAEEVEIAKTGEERGILYLRLGELRRRELSDPRGALAAFASILAEGPEPMGRTFEPALRAVDELVDQQKGTNPELSAAAAEIAEPHFARKGDFIRLVSAKEARLAAATDPSARRALRFDVATIYEQSLSQPEMAFLTLARAYAESPADAELASTLERLAALADTQEELAELFGQVLPAIDDEAFALRLARKVAEIYDVLLERGEAAVPFYNRILKLSPDDPAALRALERIHRRAGNAAALVGVYRAMLRLVEADKDAKKALWRAIAQLTENELGDLDGAFEAYRALLELDHADPQVLRAMAALCERAERLEDLAQILEREAEIAVKTDDRAQVLLRLGTLKKDRLHDLLGAVDAYAKVLELRREDPGAIAGLAMIARESGEPRARAAAALAPVYLGSGAFSDYIACLEAQLGPTKTKDERKGLFITIADVYLERLGRPEHAFTYSCRALHEDLFDEGVRARVERLALENGFFEDLAGFYLDEIDAVEDHDLALTLRRRVAEIYDRNLGDVPRAIQEYNRVLDVAPGDAESLRALERLYRAAGSFGSLAEVYRRRIAQTDEPVARASLLREFARLQAESLKDAPGAIATLRRLLDLEPNDVEALERLAKLCAEQGRASELADVLSRLIGAAPAAGEVQLRAKHQLARLKEERLGDLGGADVLYREILADAPTHEATRDHLQERLENALAEDDRELAWSMGEVLADAMRRAEEWAELVAVLRILSQTTESGFERVRLGREVAEVFETKLKKPELAFTTLAALHREAPGVVEVRAHLEGLAETLLMYEELVEVLEAGLRNVQDSEISAEVERRIAEVLDRKIVDRERAAHAWHRVLERRPMDAEALEAMDRLNLALGRWAALTDVVEKRVELAKGDDVAEHALLVRFGAIWDERLGERAEATEAYRRARALQPRDRETLLALARLLDPADPETAQELFAVLEALSEAAKDNRELVRLLPRMAQLAGGHLERRGQAIELWRRVLAIDPSHAEAVRSLDALYEQEGRWEDFAAHLEKQLTLARDEKEVLRLQRRIAFVKGTRLGSIDEAVRSWSEILKRNPNDVEALGSLRQIYRDAKRWEELIAVLRKLIPLQLDAAGVKQIRFELAETYHGQLGLKDEAIESAKRVLDVEPHTEAELMRLEELFIATGAYGEAVKVMNARVELADDDEGRAGAASAKIDILFEIAQLYETKILRKAGASSAYERILVLDATSVKAYDALAAIYESNGDYRKLVELHNRRLDSTEDPAARKKLLYSIIDIQERWLGHPELAFSAACRAFSEEGADEHAQKLAERLADQTDNWDTLAEVFLEQIDHLGLGRAVELRRRLAEVYVDELKQPDEAEEQLELVLSSRPDDEAARQLLMRILESAGRWRDLIEQIHDKIERLTELDEKKAQFRRIAELEEKKLQDVEGAISSTKRILDLDPEDPAALSELERMFRGAQKWHPLLGILGRQLELATTPEDRIRLRFEIAGVWEKGVDDSEHAIEAYRDVLILDADHVPSLKALERLFTQLERWIELVDIFERQVTLAPDASHAIQLLTRIAGIWEEEFRDLEGASATLIRILEIEPDHLPTVKSLERIWRDAGDHERLIEAYRRHIELSKDKQEIVGLHLAIAELYVRELGRASDGEAAYREALALDEHSKEAIHALGQLYEKAGNWYSALEMLDREATLEGASSEAVELHFRMGRIREDMLVDRVSAKDCFTRALDLDPSYVPAMRALRHILEDEGKYREVVGLQAQEAECTRDPVERAELYQHAAETTLDELDDVEHATKLYEKSLEAHGEHIPTLRALSDLYFGAEAWERAQKLGEKLVEKLDRHDELGELAKQNYRLAYIAEKLDDDHRALKRYLASYELDSTYLPTLEGLAAALLRAERWDDAQRIFQTILIHHKGSLTDAEVVDLHYQLGELAVRLEQLERAKKSFDKALDLDGDHVPTLRAYAALAEQLEEWEQAYDLRERLIAHTFDDERYQELVAQARLCRDKIQEPYRAIDAFSEARRERSEDPEVLRSLVKLFDETSQAPRAIEALEELIPLATDPKERRDLLVELARIQHDELKNVKAAVDALNQALDLDPMFIKAFERIEQILFGARMWPALEENYHRMIQRMPKEQKASRIVLWTSLAELYQKVLKNDDGARVALEVVLKLNPAANGVALRLAELYAKGRDTAPKAVEIHHRLLPTADDPSQPTRRLFELYTALGLLDRAFSALGALILMRAATPDEQKAYQLLLKKAPPAAKRPLTDNLWRTVLLDPACRTSLADLSSVLYRGAPDLFAMGQQPLLLKKKEKVDLTDGSKNARVRLRYFDVWQRLQNAMHVGEMDHYHRPGVGTPPRLYPGAPAVLFVGEQHEAFKELPPRQIAWILARQMATARPELALVRALAPEDMAAALEAAIRLYAPDGSGVDLQVDPKLVQEWDRLLRRSLSERAMKALRDPVVQCLERKDMKHLAKFIEGAEHTASRAALLMAGDVSVAERGLSDTDQLVEVSYRARVRALMLYSLSEDYFILREKLGLAIST